MFTKTGDNTNMKILQSKGLLVCTVAFCFLMFSLSITTLSIGTSQVHAGTALVESTDPCTDCAQAACECSLPNELNEYIIFGIACGALALVLLCLVTFMISRGIKFGEEKKNNI